MHDRPTPTLRLNLTLPSTKLTFGVLSHDPLKEMLGFDPRAALVPLLRSEPYIRTRGASAVEVFPLAIGAGTRVAIPVGAFGEFAVANDRGLLALTVPAQACQWLQDRVGALLVEGPTPIKDDDGLHRVSVAWLRLLPGARVGRPVGLLGEAGLEAA